MYQGARWLNSRSRVTESLAHLSFRCSKKQKNKTKKNSKKKTTTVLTSYVQACGRLDLACSHYSIYSEQAEKISSAPNSHVTCSKTKWRSTAAICTDIFVSHDTPKCQVLLILCGCFGIIRVL